MQIHIFSIIYQQLKLMIKPQQNIVYLCMSLLTLIAGQTPDLLPHQFLLTFTSEIKWNQVHPLITDKLISQFGRFKDQVRSRKIPYQNYKISTSYLNQSISEQNQQIQEQLIESLISIVQPLQAYLKESYQPSYMNKKKRRPSQSNRTSLTINDIHDLPQPSQLSIQPHQKRTTVKACTYVPGDRKSISSRQSTSPRSSISSNRKLDLQTRVQLAKELKVSRLDRILCLKVKKPVVQSTLNRKSTEKKDEKVILLQEISKYREEIRELQRKENDFKWKIEREAKEMKKFEDQQRVFDDICRYRENYQKNHQLDNLIIPAAKLRKSQSSQKFSMNNESRSDLLTQKVAGQ